MQTDLHTCAKFVHNRSSCLASFQHFWICDPQTPFKCPMGLEGLLFFLLFPFPDESVGLYVCQVWSWSVQGLEAFPDLWIDDPLTPSGIKGLIFTSCPFPDEYAYVGPVIFRFKKSNFPFQKKWNSVSIPFHYWQRWIRWNHNISKESAVNGPSKWHN